MRGNSLQLSPQHRLLLRRRSGQPVLAPAKALIGTEIAHSPDWSGGIDYIHLLCAQHVLCCANGIVAESLYLGPQARRSGWSAPLRSNHNLHKGILPAAQLLSVQETRHLWLTKAISLPDTALQPA